MTRRSFLLLQGVATPFFPELGKALEIEGHDVLKVNFCGGDLFSGRFFSKANHYINCKVPLEKLPTFYKDIFDQYKITDVLLFGDTRPIHQAAITLAKQQNIRLFVFEEGYFRPSWITLDKGGVNANSSISKDPEWHLKTYKQHKENTISHESTSGGLMIRAWHDIRYHAANLLFKSMFPHYQSHRPDRAVKEYWGWIKRMPMLWFFYNEQANNKITHILASNKPHYLLPLQLNADSQMKIHSPLANVSELVQTTIKSFAKYASDDAFLIIKNHPLDPWFINYPRVIQQAIENSATTKDLENRIIYLEAGNLDDLLKKTQGVVLVNSTVGTAALSQNCPVIALGEAIYDMKGLTFQGTLDDFWLHASPPDKALFTAFQANLIHQSQINGAFYNQKGIQMAVSGSLKFLSQINQEQQ